MPAPRNDLLSGEPYGTTSTRYRTEIRSVTALGLACPACLAPATEYCVSGIRSAHKYPVQLLCPARMKLALELRDSGELEPTVTAAESALKAGTWPGQPAPRNAKQNVKLTPDRLAELFRLHEAGWTQVQIAERLNISTATIYVRLKEAREQAKAPA